MQMPQPTGVNPNIMPQQSMEMQIQPQAQMMHHQMVPNQIAMQTPQIHPPQPQMAQNIIMQQSPQQPPLTPTSGPPTPQPQQQINRGYFMNDYQQR